MRFLGGFLKVLGILILVAAAVICTVIAVEAELMEAYIIMGLVWLCVLFVTLVFLGTGIALTRLHKLEEKVQHLEQRCMTLAAAQHTFTPQSVPVTQTVTHVQTESAAADPEEPVIIRLNTGAAPAHRKSKVWIPVLITAVVVVGIAGIVAVVMQFAPGRNSEISAQPIIKAETAVFATEAPTEAVPEVEAAEISLGGTLSTDFVEMTFQDIVIDSDVQYSVTTGIVTRTSGPSPLAGQQYICLSGTIKNISTSGLPVYDFFLGNLEMDGYSYTVDANDCDVLDAEGQLQSEIPPLMEYTFRIYVAIPDELAENHDSCSFNFGFYDQFENQELAYNRSFSDDPVAMCPYQFVLNLK